MQLLLGLSTGALAEDAPPLDVPPSGVLTKPDDAIGAGDWLLYPSVGIYSSYSDNLLQSPAKPISTWLFGVDPNLRAEWTSGIHTTDIYGSADARSYTPDSELDAFDDHLGIQQKYSPLRDLTFSLQGDYQHSTLATQLISAIPGAITAPGTNPNANPVLTATNPTTVINPNNTFSGVASVEKLLNGGLIGLNAGISRTEYQNANLEPDFTVETIGGRGAFSRTFIRTANSPCMRRRATSAPEVALGHVRSAYSVRRLTSGGKDPKSKIPDRRLGISTAASFLILPRQI
jgi:hypothetical protein